MESRASLEGLSAKTRARRLDLEREDPRVRDRYGRGSAAPAFGEDAGPHWMDQFLMARRLVEAGVRCVTLSFGSWDRHGANFACAQCSIYWGRSPIRRRLLPR